MWCVAAENTCFGVRVVDHDVGVGARRDRALARVEPEHPRRRGAGDLDPAPPGDVALQHAGVQQVHPVLDARQPVRDLGEVAQAQLLLPLEAERAVVGGDHREVVGAQPPPQRGLVLLGAQRRRADVLGALEARPREVVGGQEEVLRARLGERVVALVAGLRDLRQRLLRRQVHDVDRRVRHLRELDRPVGGLGLQQFVAHDAVVARVGLAAGERLLDEHVDHDAVLGVHEDQAAGLGARCSARRIWPSSE